MEVPKKVLNGWKEKKVLKEDKKSTKTIEKVIEKESEREADKIIQVKDVANDLLAKIAQANNELDKHIVTNKTKTKAVEYDYKCNKPKKETIEEKEQKTSFIDIIDRKGLKELTSALKDLNDILGNEHQDNNDRVQIINDLPEDK